MSSTTISKNGTFVTPSCSWTITNGYGDPIDYTIYKLQTDGTLLSVDTFTLAATPGPGDDDTNYVFGTSDGVYVVAYVELAVAYRIPVVRGCNILTCMEALADKAICGDINIIDIANFSSMSLAYQLLVNYINSDAVIKNMTPVTLGNFNTNQLELLKMIDVMITQCTDYCTIFNSTSDDSDCGC